MTRVNRFLMIAALLILSGSVVLDPYNWFRDASDFVLPAPYWQTALGLVNSAILIAASVSIWRQRYATAFPLLVFEFSFNIGLNLIYLYRDGLQRFSHGFAGEQYLSWYLLLLLIRAWVIAWIPRVVHQRCIGEITYP